MRRVERKPLPRGAARKLAAAERKLREQLAAGEDPPIGGAYRSEGVKRTLRDDMFERCCCFCEAPTEVAGYGEVEHYRPKADPRFKHLAYSWENLLWACRRCNGAKGNQWNNDAPLLDPCNDDPALHLSWNGPTLRGSTPRGEYTIDLLDLNGERSLQRFDERRMHLREVRRYWDDLENANRRDVARAVLSEYLGRGGKYRGMLAANGMTLDAINVTGAPD
jgi:5-methylcytosine-specific restriction endonuclease McrA